MQASIKLSEAILLGIGVVKNERKTWWRDNEGELSGCALCTALYAVNALPKYQFSDYVYEAIYEQWPWTRSIIPTKYTDIAREISYRHFSGKSRESLAAFVASIEPQEHT